MAHSFANAMPIQGLLGGLMIGTAAAIMSIATAFVVGLPLGALLIIAVLGPVEARFPTSLGTIVLGGLLVGFGTRLGSGCTSGHGVCGMSRFSPRSLIATASFITAGIATVAAMNALGFRQ
jgi:uncharacterized membrane protein YedE/YeeE